MNKPSEEELKAVATAIKAAPSNSPVLKEVILDKPSGLLPANQLQETDGPSLVRMVELMNLEPKTSEMVIGLIKHLIGGGVYKSYLDEHNVTWDQLAAICFGKPSLWKAIDSAHYAARIQRLRRLESEAMRRAVDGVTQPVYQGKEHVGDRQEYSDDLMKVMLKAHDPDTYADRSKVEHAGVMVNFNIEGVNRNT